MFEPTEAPRVFGLPPGADFPAALVAHLRATHADRPPEALARVRLIVNTRRMVRRIRALFDAGPPCLLPRIELVTDLGRSHLLADLPDPAPNLRRRLQLTRIVAALIEAQPDLAPRAALHDLSDSLAVLMDEMQANGVAGDALDRLDVSDLSGHWARALDFLRIARDYAARTAEGEPGPEERQARVAARLATEWAVDPPRDPVILAGSTGSRRSTRALMEAVARLPQGTVLLPGYDFDMPDAVWATMDDPLGHEDHPQFRFALLLRRLGLAPGDVRPWPGGTAPAPGRNRVVSLALRPAPVTHQWRAEGPDLPAPETAMAGVTLIEAPSSRDEALAIAMRLRAAVEEDVTAALITPDRLLTRQVAAQLDRWGITPDDSAGEPLHLAPAGRLLRHVAGLYRDRLTAEMLLALLKHPLTHTGSDRGGHLTLTRRLEKALRRHGPPHPDRDFLAAFAERQGTDAAAAWARWVTEQFMDRRDPEPRDLAARVADHLALADAISAGRDGATGSLWRVRSGDDTARAIRQLVEEAGHGGPISARDYVTLIDSLLSRGEVRDPDTGHPGVLIWGTLEARVQGADLVILGGLNEGTWPVPPAPDPWLNRTMRHRIGLPVPERRIGLSAHDFQQAAAAPEVWLTRAIRSQDAETVPSRWIARLVSLLDGLDAGRPALAAMRSRGAEWLDRARQLEAVERVPPAPRPAPCPPVDARPRQLSVTEIQTLIRDPYAIYAKRVLRLKPLDPLMKVPDALLRGTVVHAILEAWLKAQIADGTDPNAEALLRVAETHLDGEVPWPEARVLWHARLSRVAGPFVRAEVARQSLARPTWFEVKGEAALPEFGFRLTAKADRIDLDPAGNLHLYDYKTGQLPSEKTQLQFDRQLLLSAAIASLGGFDSVSSARIAAATYLGVGAGAKVMAAPVGAVPPEAVWLEFRRLIGAWMEEGRGFTARRAMFSKTDTGDYDQLARFGEWDVTAPPDARPVR